MSKEEIWHPAVIKRGDARAIQSLATYAQLAEIAWDPKTMGDPPPTPTPFEVKRALDWIINQAAQTYDNGTAASLDGSDPHGRVAAFVDGRRNVGQQIIKAMKLKADLLEEG